MYLVTSIAATCRGNVSPSEIVMWVPGTQRMVENESIQFYLDHPEFSAVAIDYDTTYSGKHAAGNIDFNAAGEAEMTVVIGGVTYTEADTAVPASGVFTNGASAADSAASLIAAINGDLRATVPVTAVADISEDGVWLYADAEGTAGNLVITTTSASNCTVMDMTGGEASSLKRTVSITHAATAQELLSGGIEIPIPFAATTLSINVLSATGAPVYTTDLVTIEEDPARVRIATTGATNVAATDVIHLVVSS